MTDLPAPPLKGRALASRKLILGGSILIVIIFFLVIKSETWENPLLINKPEMGAMVYLRQYAKLFSQKGLAAEVKPELPSTISTWWQAVAMIDWYMHMPKSVSCEATTAMGNWGICQDQHFKVKPPCLVYSFGIDWDFSFDDAMGKLGCEVHSFDPSMHTGDHKHSDHVTFHNLGLAAVNQDDFQPRRDIYVKDNQKWKVRTLKGIVEMLGHENRTIDVLKMDIEGYEWDVVENILDTGMAPFVRQLDVEWHLFHTFPQRSEYVRFYKIMNKLRELGFQKYRNEHISKSMNPSEYNNQENTYYVNIYF